MDTRKLTDVLRATIEPNQRQQAEEQLSQIQKIIGFSPSLLQVVMTNDVPLPVRQAGVVYLKNLVNSGWQEKEPDDEEEDVNFSRIHDQDKAMIRDAIVDAIIQSPDIIRIQLCDCLKTIIKNDFPAKWTQVVDKIHIYLQNPDANSWMGALMCLYQLIKCYEYQITGKRVPLIEAMNLLLPMMYNLSVNLQTDQSETSVLIQKQILKCFFCLIKYILPLELINRESFSNWMEVLRRVISEPVPIHTLQIDEDERVDLPWWKCKKWAMHILYRIFERFGSPVNCRQEYVQFAEWYLTTFTGGILEVLLQILDQYRQKVYISPRVLQLTLSYVDLCVSHAHSWKLLKVHMFVVIQDVLFQMMCYSNNDEELWNNDPHEYIRVKFDIFEDYISPVTAAQTLLISACKKRKDMLHRTMQYCMQVLTNQSGEFGPRQVDGALHMVGTLSDIVMKKKAYKDEIEGILNTYIFPSFNNPLGFMRARAAWVLRSFAGIRFKNDQLLIEACRLVVNSLLRDPDLPVKVEAAIAIQSLLSSQEKAHGIFQPQVGEITLELLKVIRETENDSLAGVLQKIVPLYTENLMPIAVEITEHLASTFSNVIETDASSDEKAITAMGLLNTIETVVNAMIDNPEIMKQIETTVLRVVGHVLQHNVIGVNRPIQDDQLNPDTSIERINRCYEFYEEAMSLLCDLTSKSISEDMWKVLELIYQVFEKEGFDYFTEMMPVLYNFVTVDTNAFLSDENRILAMFNMCKAVLSTDTEDESEIYAAKLIEVIILQCSGKIDNCLPSFIRLVVMRLAKKVKTSELRIMLLQVLIAQLYLNPHLLFSIIEGAYGSEPDPSIGYHFIKQWIHDVDCFMGLHDRKICVLGICKLLEMGPNRPNLEEVMPKLLPSCLVLFEGLKRAYETRAEQEDYSSSDEEEEDDDIVEVLSSDEDDLTELSMDYLDNLARLTVKNSAQQGVEMQAKIEELYDSDYDDDFDPAEDSAVECYGTPLDEKDCVIDEYIQFKNTLTGLSSTDPALYHALTSALTEEQQKALQAVFVLADQRKAQQDSKRIEQSGGYSFTVPAQVPTKFKFGS